MRVGVVVGRFQLDRLHEGHEALLRHVEQASDLVCVVIGVTENLCSRRNPLDFPTRKLLIEEWARDWGFDHKFIILAQADHTSDHVWSKNLDRMLTQAFPGHKLTLYGGRDSFLKHYHGKLSTQDLTNTVHVEGGRNATGIRELKSRQPLASAEFRHGVIYGAYNQWPRLFMCVDIAVIQDRSLLLGKRKSEDKARFFGGFVDQKDPSLTAAALRELKEESGLPPEHVQIRFLDSRIISDRRYRSPDDGLLMTSFFLAEHTQAWVPLLPLAGDDIDELVWLPLDTPRERMLELITGCHTPLMQILLDTLKKEGKYNG